MNVLYYSEPSLTLSMSGVNNVAHNLPQALGKKINIVYFPSFRFQWTYARSLLKVYGNFTIKKFDIIHLNLVPQLINGSSLMVRLAKMEGTYTILTIHGYIPNEKEFFQKARSKSIYFNRLSNTIKYCKIVDKIVVNSNFMHSLVATGYNVDYDKIVVIPNGVDMGRFEISESKITLEGDPAVLYLGYLANLKGIDVLIKAVNELQSELPKLKLHIAGHGDKNEFLRLAKKLGVEDRVVFYGGIPYSNIAQWYKSADMCIFPSRHEAFGITLLEAMASKKPIVVSDIPAFREIVSDGKNGLLFKTGNETELARAILKLYNNLNLRQVLSQNAFETAKRYNWDNIASKYISLYESLGKQPELLDTI